MKRYLLFQSLESDFNLTTPQYVLCGNPRVATLNPTSNATTYLWEQIQPDPLIIPITIVPNNTSKDVQVLIPSNITEEVILRITLNGNTNNYQYVTIDPLLKDKPYQASKGKLGIISFDNTLNNLLQFRFVPIPSDGSQAINFTTNGQQTGVQFLPQYYRNAYTESININSESTPINIINENRTKQPINTNILITKNWQKLTVVSQPIVPVNQIISLSFPAIIADEITTNSYSKGKALISFTRTPYLVQNINNIDIITNNTAKGKALISFTRIPYSAQNLNNIENITNNTSKGKAVISFTRTPYTSNVIG